MASSNINLSSPSLLASQRGRIIDEVDRLYHQYNNPLINSHEDYETLIAVRSRLCKLEELYDASYFSADPEDRDQQLHAIHTDTFVKLKGKLILCCEAYEQQQQHEGYSGSDSPELPLDAPDVNIDLSTSPHNRSSFIPSSLNSRNGGFQGFPQEEVAQPSGQQLGFQPVSGEQLLQNVVEGSSACRLAHVQQPSSQPTAAERPAQDAGDHRPAPQPEGNHSEAFQPPSTQRTQYAQSQHMSPHIFRRCAPQAIQQFQSTGGQHFRTFPTANYQAPQQPMFAQQPPQMQPAFVSQVPPPIQYIIQQPAQFQGFKLPEISLPKFSGEFNNWLDFRSSFSTIVKDNASVSPDVKFHYLKSSLGGEAYNMILHVPAGRFDMAWSLLTERYDNPRMIADQHVAAILSPPTLNSNNAESWRMYIDHLKQHIFALESIDLKVDIKTLLYMYVIISGFDARTLRDWERFSSQSTVPSLNNLWGFMESQHKISLAVSSGSSEPTDTKTTNLTLNSNQRTKPAQSSARAGKQQVSNNQNVNRTRSPNFNQARRSFSCQFCKNPNHGVFQCLQLQRLNPVAKWEAVNNKGLCFNCLKPFTTGHTCFGFCRQCSKPHHTLLHEGAGQTNFSNKMAVSNSLQARPCESLSIRPHSPCYGSESRPIASGSNSNISDGHSSQCSARASLVSQPCHSIQTLNAVHSPCSSSPAPMIEPTAQSTAFSGHASSAVQLHSKPNYNVTVMPTAQVLVLNAAGQAVRCRALLDTGSDSCLISQELASKLALPVVNCDKLISTVAETKTRTTVAHIVTIKSTNQMWSSQEECMVVTEISPNIPQFNLDLSTFSVPENINLADPHFHQSNGVDILLGASVFASIMICGQISTAPGAPIIQNTNLGWIIFGSIKLLTPVPKPRHYHVNCVSSSSLDTVPCSIDISNQLEKFWKLEELAEDVRRPAQELKIEAHYNETTRRLNDGRFVVRVPRKDNIVNLGSSKKQAHDRFLSLERRLAKNTDLKNQYVTFMREYESLNHMSVAPPLVENELAYYIPHHPVFKPDSTTTKLRVVFDASAKSTSGISLNDTLFTGHKVQPDLFDIVLRFRMHKVAFIADIAKMYRQVLLDSSDRNLHRIFWRENDSLPLKQYCLNTITYGTGPAAFLATRTLIKLAELETSSDSPVFQSICNDFYIDDCISGGPTVDQAISIAHDLISLLSRGGFELRKFMSSSNALIDSIPNHLVETSTVKPVSEADDGVTKALGLLWNSKFDALSISSNLTANCMSSSTKRQLLSVVASIYDPLGLVSPLVIRPKILIQKLWLLKLGWDDKLPPELLLQWVDIVQHLPNIEKISMPRCVLVSQPDSALEIHGFADASSNAFGACVYVCSNVNGSIQSHLLCSKSRVAPLKLVSIPRLELSAALLLSQLVVRVMAAFDQLKIHIERVFLWSDSTIVCNWLKALPEKKDVFVSVRVAAIQETTSSFTWNHVRTSNNPADLISRGVAPSALIDNQLWWHGPAWLAKPDSHWDSFSSKVDVVPPPNVILASNTSVSIFAPLLAYFSGHTKMIRAAAYVLRFLHNIRHPNARRSNESLSIEELNEAETLVIKSVQEVAFESELKQLRDDRELSSNSNLKSLFPFIHEDGLLRVGGRLENADATFDFKHQILIPSKHKFTRALIVSTHQRLCHAGVAATMAALRQRYWIPSTRRTVKAVLRCCLKCFRFTQFKAEQLMGQLPAVRVNMEAPFLNTGLDYLGPLSLRVGGPKSRTYSKAYIAIFICMVTRAVHLEVVSELSTKAFIAALNRFASVRGIPSSIYSDNGTTFVGANNELKELQQFLSSAQTQRTLQNSAAAWKIQWHFIPPRAPNFGGLWERSIKSFKSIFKVVTLKQILNFEEMATLSAQVGAILNSRPIEPLSEDPYDLAYLSPGHFLIGRPLNALPSKPVKTTHINHLARWQRISEMNQQLWDRWSQEYLVSLQKRSKWTSTSPNVIVGSLVLLKDPGTPPTYWKLGRITQVITGADKLVRVVMVMTESGIFKRSIASIAPLPIDDTNEDPSSNIFSIFLCKTPADFPTGGSLCKISESTFEN